MFRQFNDPLTGQLRDDMVLYSDPQGHVFTVPRGHRIWLEIYEPWLAAGNSPLPPN